jgi:mRNA interferase MazF
VTGGQDSTCAPINRTVRGIRSEVEIRAAQGPSDQSVISCDNLITVPATLLEAEPVDHLDLNCRIRLDQALRYALDIQY